MNTIATLIMAGIVWKVVRFKFSPPRARLRRRGDSSPWLVALVSDAIIFGGLAYREHRRRAAQGKATARRGRMPERPGFAGVGSHRHLRPQPDDDLPF